MTAKNEAPIKLGLPKGRMQAGVIRLLADAGIEVRVSDRGYRPRVSIPWIEAKILKPQNIIEMLHIGSRDLGFAGADWVAELQVDLVELLNTELDPVELVAAAPRVSEKWNAERQATDQRVDRQKRLGRRLHKVLWSHRSLSA